MLLNGATDGKLPEGKLMFLLVIDIPFYLFSSETLLIFFPDVIILNHTSSGSKVREK